MGGRGGREGGEKERENRRWRGGEKRGKEVPVSALLWPVLMVLCVCLFFAREGVQAAVHARVSDGLWPVINLCSVICASIPKHGKGHEL